MSELRSGRRDAVLIGVGVVAVAVAAGAGWYVGHRGGESVVRVERAVTGHVEWIDDAGTGGCILPNGGGTHLCGALMTIDAVAPLHQGDPVHAARVRVYPHGTDDERASYSVVMVYPDSFRGPA